MVMWAGCSVLLAMAVEEMQCRLGYAIVAC
jgi:hypothetical protein